MLTMLSSVFLISVGPNTMARLRGYILFTSAISATCKKCEKMFNFHRNFAWDVSRWVSGTVFFLIHLIHFCNFSNLMFNTITNTSTG